MRGAAAAAVMRGTFDLMREVGEGRIRFLIPLA